MNKRKTYFNWSTGKDASLALYLLKQNPELEIDLLLTSVNSHYNRVSMHGLHRDLLVKQAEAIGLPLTTIELPEKPTMEEYGEILTQKVLELKDKGYTDTGFGDIFLEDLRDYRIKQLKPYDIQTHFPLWKKDTKSLVKEMIEMGFKMITVCIKSELLDKSFIGRVIDQSFIDELPDNVDPCGENGEFHTFCFDGPLFKHPVAFEIGEKTYREYNHGEETIGFWFCDLIAQ